MGYSFYDLSYMNYYGGLNLRMIDQAKNGSRIKDHHRLDLGITGSFIWGRFLIKPYLQVLNVYCSSFQIIMNNVHIDDEDSYEYPNSYIIPTLGVDIEF